MKRNTAKMKNAWRRRKKKIKRKGINMAMKRRRRRRNRKTGERGDYEECSGERLVNQAWRSGEIWSKLATVKISGDAVPWQANANVVGAGDAERAT